MPRSTAIFSVSLPPKMAAELERLRKTEHRTRSELVREALRTYIRLADFRGYDARVRELPEEDALSDEIEAVRQGQQMFRRGRHRLLKDLRHELLAPRQRSRGKKP